MKVAVVTEWVDSWRGGAETSTQQFMHHLQAEGIELHLFTRSRPSPAPGMFVHTVSGAAMSRVRRSVTFAHRVERLLKADRFDVIHAITPCRGVDIYQPRGGTIAETIERNLALRRRGPARSLKKYASHFNLKQRYLRAIERRIFRDPQGPIVVAISDYVVRQFKRHYGVPDERIRKIFNGVDPPATSPEDRARDRAAIRREFGFTDQQVVVLCVAHNFKLKGVRRWMEALALMVRQGVTDLRSLVVGKGDSQLWHRLAARLGIARVLTFVGPSDRVRQIYHAGDMLVHPTYYDPCSRVVLEAMVAGLPCITTRWDGASEVIDPGRNGYVLDDPGDVRALADYVARLRDAEHRRALSEAARKVVDAVSMARHTREVIELYEQIRRHREARRS